MADDHLDGDELILWHILYRLEALALDRYERFAPMLAISAKREITRILATGAPDQTCLKESVVKEPFRQLLDAASSGDETETLIIQGLLLERLGQVIYKVMSKQSAVSAATRSLGSAGRDACIAAIALAEDQLSKTVGKGETLFDVFTAASDEVLKKLDGLGDAVDTIFGQRYGLTFSELLGEFTAELLPACVALGMNRRKVVCHLASAFMGQ
jgi:hypothetical protein